MVERKLLTWLLTSFTASVIAREASWMTSSGRPTSSSNRSTWLDHTQLTGCSRASQRGCCQCVHLVEVVQSGAGGCSLLLLAARQLDQKVLLLHLCCGLLEALQSLQEADVTKSTHQSPSSLGGGVAATHLLALPISQVTLGQHEAAGADVHLTPGTNQPDVLLEATNSRAEPDP